MFKKRISKNSPSGSNTVFDIHPREGSAWSRLGETVSLRRHLYRRHPILTSVGALAAVLVIALTADTFLGHANTVHWYPQSCLGGWINPANAAGAPELPLSAKENEFTADNSAILNDSISQIFCGGFGGDAPENSLPLAAILNISWVFKTAPGPEGITQSDPEVAGTSTPAEIDPSIASSTVPEPSEILGPSDVPITEETPSEPELEPEPVSIPEPVTESIPEPSPEPVSAPAPAPEPEPAPAAEPTSQLWSPVRLAFAQEMDPATTSDSETIPDTSDSEDIVPIEETDPAQRDILEVNYSIGGETWQTLGTVSESGWQGARFGISINSWDDLKNLQISIASLPVSDAAPVVYLDGLSLMVVYGSADGLVPEAELLAEDLQILPETPLPPPLQERKVVEILEVDENAKHSCAAEPFRTDVSGASSTAANIALKKGGSGLEEVGIGYLPQGIDIVFEKSGAYVYHPGSDETSIGLEIKSGSESQKGDFNIPIIYSYKGIKDSSVVCQLNIVNR